MARMASPVSGAAHRWAAPWVRRMPFQIVRTSGLAAGVGEADVEVRRAEGREGQRQ
jgi:hypothetical protein